MIKITEYKISFFDDTETVIIPVVQGDTGRVIKFTPKDATLSASYTATWFVKKPSGNAVYYTATIVGGSVVCELTAQALAEKGESYLYVRIYDQNETVVSSFRSVLKVQESPVDAIESTTETNIFDQAVEDAIEEIGNVLDPTLKIANKAAESKAVGDLIHKIVPEWEEGKTYSQGQMVIYNGTVYRRKDTNASASYSFKQEDWVEDSVGLYFAKWLGGLIIPYQDRFVSYAVGDYCVNDGIMYRCITPIAGSSTKHPFDSSEWVSTNVGYQLSNLKQNYNTLSAEVGDIGMYTLGLYPQKSVADVAVASFADGADDIPVKSLTVDVTPVQDLHGQANPYPDGGGKNKAKPLGTQTNQGITITTNSKGETTASGTATQEVTFVGGSFTADAGNYYLNGCPNGGNLTTTFDLYIWDTTTSSRPYKWDGVTGSSSVFNANEQSEIKIESGHQYTVIVRFRSGFSPNNIVFRPMLRLSSVSDATFAPYSNICPISGWTGANVTRTGKNLLKLRDVSYTDSGLSVALNSQTGGVTLSGARSANGIISLTNGNDSQNLVKLAAGTYIFSCVNADANVAFLQIMKGDNSAQLVQSNGPDVSYTFSETTLIRPRMFVIGNATTNRTLYPMIRPSSMSDATFEPFGTIYSITFPSSAGTVYGGTLDVTSGVLTVTNGYVDLGTLSWSYRSEIREGLFSASISGCKSATDIDAMCSSYVYIGAVGNVADVTVDKTCALHRSASTIYIYDTSYTTAEAFKTAMSGVQLVYEFATPNIAQLSPTEVTTLLRNNNIFADCGNINELTYRADLKAYIDSVIS